MCRSISLFVVLCECWVFLLHAVLTFLCFYLPGCKYHTCLFHLLPANLYHLCFPECECHLCLTDSLSSDLSLNVSAHQDVSATSSFSCLLSPDLTCSLSLLDSLWVLSLLNDQWVLLLICLLLACECCPLLISFTTCWLCSVCTCQRVSYHLFVPLIAFWPLFCLLGCKCHPLFVLFAAYQPLLLARMWVSYFDCCQWSLSHTVSACQDVGTTSCSSHWPAHLSYSVSTCQLVSAFTCLSCFLPANLSPFSAHQLVSTTFY